MSDEEPAAQFTLCELDELEGATVVDHRDALRRRTDGLVGGFCHVLARAQPQGTLIEARRSSTPGHGERFMAVEVQGPRPLSVDLAHGKLAVADAQRVEVYDQRRGVSVWRASLAAGAPGQLMHVMWHPGHQLTVERLDDQGWWRQGFDGLTGKSLGQERLDKRVQDALRDPIGALQARLGEPEGSLIPAKGREHALIGASLDALTLRVPRGDSSCPGEFYEVRAQEATPQAASKPGALLCSDPKRLTRDSAAWVLGPDRALLIEVGVADTGPEPRLTKARVACAAVHLIELPSGRALGRWMERVKAR